jgi:hypothetical protein
MHKELEQYALYNYEQGGQWVVECFDRGDYDRYIAEAGGDLNKAKKALKKYWLLIEGQARECRAM